MGNTLVNGITVAYEDVGEGDSVLVLVHGHPFNRTMWQPQMEWVRGFNRDCARSRARSEGVDTMTGSEGLGDDVGVEPATPQNLEHEDEGGGTWRAIVPDLRGYGESTVVAGKTTLDIFASDLDNSPTHSQRRWFIAKRAKGSEAKT
jgi:pimeloyl-ACP methyl ester carboxylesterase